MNGYNQIEKLGRDQLRGADGPENPVSEGLLQAVERLDVNVTELVTCVVQLGHRLEVAGLLKPVPCGVGEKSGTQPPKPLLVSTRVHEQADRLARVVSDILGDIHRRLDI